VDLAVSKQIRRWVDFGFDNLTDKQYFETQNYLESGVTPTAPVVARILYDRFPEILDDAGSANLPLLSLGGIIHMNHRNFFCNALNRAQGHSRQTGHFGLGVTGLQ
jgi:hypothetical protein